MKKDDRGNLLIGAIVAIGALKLFLNVLVIQLLSKYCEWIFVPLLIPVLFIAFLLEGPILDLTALLLLPAPPVPEIQYAEFPFEIVYEVDGNVYKINDSLVCEYEGIEFLGSDIARDAEKYLDWNVYIKGTGGNEDLPLKEFDDGAKLCIYLGDIDYWMFGEVDDYTNFPGEMVYYSKPNFSDYLEEFDEEEYGIKIISTKFSEPLEENKCEYRTIDKIRMSILSYINRELMLC